MRRGVLRNLFLLLISVWALILFSFSYQFGEESIEIEKEDWERKSIKDPNNDISIIYTWVNESDANYEKQLDEHGGKTKQRKEIQFIYSLRSLEKNLEWWNGTLYLVSPKNHVPHWMNRNHPRLRIVPQESILPNLSLPFSFSHLRTRNLESHQLWKNVTFNTNAIEPFFCLIPGMSQHFLYLNDDYFFLKKFFWTDFYTKEGAPRIFLEKNVIRGGFKEMKDAKSIWVGSIFFTNGWLNRLFQVPHSIRYYLKHAPYAYTLYSARFTNQIFFSQIKDNMNRFFRSRVDVVHPFLHHHLLASLSTLKNSSIKPLRKSASIPPSVISDFSSIKAEIASEEEMEGFSFYRISTEPNVNERIFEKIRKTDPKFVTFNGGLDSTDTIPLNQFENFLKDMFPTPSSFELLQ